MSSKHDPAITRLNELLAKPNYAIFQGEWVTKEWGEEHFGDDHEGEMVSLCSPELIRYLLDQLASKNKGN
jgi:hypothetical protein